MRFAFRFTRAYRLAAVPFGIRPDNAWVEVRPDVLSARFGPWKVTTPRANVIGAELTGPYAFAKTAGSARLAFTDRGLTFATNGERGVRIDFRDPIPGLLPTRALKHPELTVTVADLDGLVRALELS